MDILTRLSIPELLPKQAMSEHTAQLGWWKSRALHLHWVRSHIRAGAVASQCSGTVFSLVCSLVFSLVFSPVFSLVCRTVGECCCEGLSVSQLPYNPTTTLQRPIPLHHHHLKAGCPKHQHNTSEETGFPLRAALKRLVLPAEKEHCCQT